jgi:hypothetical protein
MRLRIPSLPDDASTEERFLAIARTVVNTTPAELAEEEALHEESKAARGVKKRGPAKGEGSKGRHAPKTP